VAGTLPYGTSLAMVRKERGDAHPARESRSPAMLHPTPIVFVVDDDVSIRNSVEVLIRGVGWQPETFASAQEFLSRPAVLAPSCVVVEAALPDLSGLELQQRKAADRSGTPIIFISRSVEVWIAVQAMKAGAVEFLTKPFRDDELLTAMRHAIERSRTAIHHEAETRALRDAYASLSRREREVMELVVAGRLNKQVASELRISEITVKAHRGRVMRKMQAGSLADLVRMAARLRLAPPSSVTLSPASRSGLPSRMEAVAGVWSARRLARAR